LYVVLRQVLLVVTEAFTQDWACSFATTHAQRSLSDVQPDRVLVLFLQDPRHLPPMASLEKLLQRYPDRCLFRLPPHLPRTDPEWTRLARAILGEGQER
jgi:hypothetical protein